MSSRSSSSGNSSGPASASSAGKSIDFSYPVNITADPATNAMVVSASPQDWQTLKQIIDDLDTPRVQIFVQAVIVEVSAERQREIGVNFNTADFARQQHARCRLRSISANSRVRSAIRSG